MAIYQDALLDQMTGRMGPNRRRRQVGDAFGIEDGATPRDWTMDQQPNDPLMDAIQPGGVGVVDYAPSPDGVVPPQGGVFPPASFDDVEGPGMGAATPTTPNYAFRNQMEGIDFAKFDNPEHKTPKYQIARTLAGFDPTKGLTSEAIAALNALGLGTFRANKEGGDFLYVDNGSPEFNGVTGADVVRDLGRGGWVGWGGNYGTEEAAQDAARGGSRGGGMAATPMAGAQIASQLQGDPIQRILAAIGKLSGSDSPNIDALLRQLQGG